MKKQKQNRYAARCGLSQIGGQVFTQKKKRCENATFKVTVGSVPQSEKR